MYVGVVINILECNSHITDYTADQVKALEKISDFMVSDRKIFTLAGYAGTGKTALIENMFKYSVRVKKHPLLMSITNRAVHVMRQRFSTFTDTSDYSTIHTALYGKPIDDQKMIFDIGNPHALDMMCNVAVIDEFSMVPKPIVSDVKHAGRKIQLVFVGDAYQLRPVGEDQDYLKNPDHMLSDVVRYDSALLVYATAIRKEKKVVLPQKSFGNVNVFSGDPVAKFLEVYMHTESKSAVLIVSSNKERVVFNRRIRETLHGGSSDVPLVDSERLISISNNKHFSNGAVFDVDTVISSDGSHFITLEAQGKKYTCCFIRYTVRLENGDTAPLFLFPDVLAPSLANSQIAELVEFSNGERIVDFNTIIATYGNCISCHKAQGGQWDSVVVHQTYFKQDPRWLYTALTRAEKDVYVNLVTWHHTVCSPVNVIEEMSGA